MKTMWTHPARRAWHRGRATGLLCATGLTIVAAGLNAEPPTLPPEELLALNDGFAAAFAAHDATKAASFFAEDGVVGNAGAQNKSVGPEEIAAGFAALFNGFPDYETVSEQRWVSPPFVVTQHGTLGTFENDWGGLPATGVRGTKPLLHLDIWEFRGDQVASKPTYVDIQTFLIGVGLMPPVSVPPVSPSFALPAPDGSGKDAAGTVEETLDRFNAGDLAGVAERMAPDVQVWRAPWDATVDRATSIALDEMLLAGMPDRRWEIQRLIDLGDGWVVVEVTLRGTHTAPYLGIPGTGHGVEVPMAVLYQVDPVGMITDQRIFYDNIDLMQQLGAMDPVVIEAGVNDGKLVLSWPLAPSQGMVLETADSLPDGTWLPVDETPVTVGDRYQVTLNVTSATGFFRLRRP